MRRFSSITALAPGRPSILLGSHPASQFIRLLTFHNPSVKGTEHVILLMLFGSLFRSRFNVVVLFLEPAVFISTNFRSGSSVKLRAYLLEPVFAANFDRTSQEKLSDLGMPKHDERS